MASITMMREPIARSVLVLVNRYLTVSYIHPSFAIHFTIESSPRGSTEDTVPT